MCFLVFDRHVPAEFVIIGDNLHSEVTISVNNRFRVSDERKRKIQGSKDVNPKILGKKNKTVSSRVVRYKIFEMLSSKR